MARVIILTCYDSGFHMQPSSTHNVPSSTLCITGSLHILRPQGYCRKHCKCCVNRYAYLSVSNCSLTLAAEKDTEARDASSGSRFYCKRAYHYCRSIISPSAKPTHIESRTLFDFDHIPLLEPCQRLSRAPTPQRTPNLRQGHLPRTPDTAST